MIDMKEWMKREMLKARKEALKQLRIMRDCNYPVSFYRIK